QQAMTLLKADGLIEKVGKRGMAVTALDVVRMQHHYDLRGLIDGYVARRAAERIRSGELDKTVHLRSMDQFFRNWNRRGPKAPYREQVIQDERFHHAIYEMSGNTTVIESVRPHWRFLRRAMVEVLRQAEPPAEIWDQHAAIAEAILSGEPERAEGLAQSHTIEACLRLTAALSAEGSSQQGCRVAS
ncbi:MAG: GntR family transcriptional regulator, partial [Paracoccaceae bacterium]